MKQECLFEIKNKSIFLKSTNEEIYFSSPEKIDFSLELASQNIAFAENSVAQIRVRMATLCLGDDNYDENLLAALRSFLKKLEEAKVWAVIEPVLDGPASLQGNFDCSVFVETVAHTARRIKDCKSVMGIAVPSQFSALHTTNLTSALKKKHPHYIYFLKNGEIFMA